MNLVELLSCADMPIVQHIPLASVINRPCILTQLCHKASVGDVRIMCTGVVQLIRTFLPHKEGARSSGGGRTSHHVPDSGRNPG